MLYISVYSKDVRLPIQLQRAMAAEAEAAREARAKVSRGRRGKAGEKGGRGRYCFLLGVLRRFSQICRRGPTEDSCEGLGGACQVVLLLP